MLYVSSIVICVLCCHKLIARGVILNVYKAQMQSSGISWTVRDRIQNHILVLRRKSVDKTISCITYKSSASASSTVYCCVSWRMGQVRVSRTIGGGIHTPHELF